MTSSLVLLAGNYGPKKSAVIQPHLLKLADGSSIFDRMVVNAPTDNVTVVCPREQLGFWNDYKISEELKHGKPMNIFVEPFGRIQATREMSYYLTSHIPSIFLNLEIDDIVFSTASTYFENFDFMPELMKRKNAIVVSKVPESMVPASDIIRVGLTGKIEGTYKAGVDEPLRASILDSKPMLAKDLAFTSVFKTTTHTMLEKGIFRGGDFFDTIRWLMGRGIQIDAIKSQGVFIDCGSPLGLGYAQNIQIVRNT